MKINDSLFYAMADNLTSCSNVPIVVFKDSKMIYKSNACIEDDKFYESILEWMKDEEYIWFDHLFLMASFKQDDIKVLLGPALSSTSSKEDLLGVIDQMKISFLKKEMIVDELCSSSIVPYAVFQNVKNILEIIVKRKSQGL